MNIIPIHADNSPADLTVDLSAIPFELVLHIQVAELICTSFPGARICFPLFPARAEVRL